jgi:hypothetical protein
MMSPEEIKAAWANTEGQGNKEARQGQDHAFNVLIPCSEEEAVALTRIIYMSAFSIATCAHYDNYTLSFYCGGSGDPDHLMSRVRRLAVEFFNKRIKDYTLCIERVLTQSSMDW